MGAQMLPEPDAARRIPFLSKMARSSWPGGPTLGRFIRCITAIKIHVLSVLGLGTNAAEHNKPLCLPFLCLINVL